MKQGLVVGWVCLFIICLILNSIVEANTGMNTTQSDWFNVLLSPAGANNSGSLIAQSSIITHVWDFVRGFFGILLLWFPSLFAGSFIIVWWVLCVPVGVGFSWAIVSLLRGVHSS